MAGGAIQKFYEGAPENTIQKHIWTEKIKPNYESVMMSDITNGLEQILKKENYVYSIYDIIGKSSPHFPCAVTPVGPKFNENNLVFAIKKDSPFLEPFRQRSSLLDPAKAL